MSTTPFNTIKKRTVIYDHNGINDDLVGLLLLLCSDNIQLNSILVTPAACLLKDGLEATMRILAFFGRTDIPIAGGHIHGQNPYPYEQRVSPKAICALPQLIHLTMNRKLVTEEPADEFLITQLTNAKEPVTILLAAPPTNLVSALKKAPEIKNKIEEVVVIGGAVGVPGNVTQYNHDSSSEWNFFWDPKSTKKLFNSGLKITLFPLDVNNQIPNDLSILKRLAKQKKYQVSDLACQIWAPSLSFTAMGSFHHFMSDVLAASYLGCDQLVNFRTLELDTSIEYPTEGKIIRANGSGNFVNVAKDINLENYTKFYLETLKKNVQIMPEDDKFSTVRKRKVLFDHDGATDDMVSLQLLLSMENIDLIGISIIPSDCLMDDAVECTLKLLSLYGKTDVPITKGVRYGPNPFPYEFRVYAKLINIMPLMVNQKINPKQVIEDEASEDFMIRLLKASNEKVTVLLTGPATNFIAALEKDPSIKEKIEEVVWMGGAVDVYGNVRQHNHDGSAEWNVYYDPVAGKKLFESGLEIALFSLDSTNQVPVNLDFLKKLADQRSFPSSYLASQIWTPTAKKIDTGSHDYTYCMWDVLAVGYLGCDKLCTFKRAELDVITKAPSEGKTVRAEGNGHWVNVADRVNVDGFFRYYYAQLRKDLRIDEEDA